MPADPVADEFLKGYVPVATETSIWANGDIHLEISAYLTTDDPPAGLVTSARALVFRGDQILVMTNEDGVHIHPGGRVEQGETYVETLRRELIEEAGIEITDIQRLGLIHLRHTSPKPEGYPFVYPDFQTVFEAHYLRDSDVETEPDDYEVSAEFVPLSEVDVLDLGPGEIAFLNAAKKVQ